MISAPVIRGEDAGGLTVELSVPMLLGDGYPRSNRPSLLARKVLE